jgi:malonyl-CoA decarboxylase
MTVNTNIKPFEAALGIKPVGAKGFPAILTQLLRRRGASQRTPGHRELGQLRAALDECAACVGGEVSARKRAASIAQAYREFDDAGKLAVFNLLHAEFGPPESAITAAIHGYLAAAGTDKRKAEATLRLALMPPRTRMLMQFNFTTDGVKFLVDMRADILRLLPRHPELHVLDQELHELLAIWFDHGFLELRRITWSAPASLLEKLIAYEAVHEIRSWSDLRNRLDLDRRCYAFFHPRMSDRAGYAA